MNTDRYVGVRYKFLGESFEDGFDCGSIVFHFLNSLGYATPLPWKEFTKGLGPRDIVEAVVAWGEKNAQKLQAPDLHCVVAFKADTGLLAHAGVMVSSDRFLNIYHGHTAHLAMLDDAWSSRIHSCWRLPWAQ